MSRKHLLVVLAPILLCLVFAVGAPRVGAQDAPDDQAVMLAYEQCPEFRSLVSADGWLERLSNPALTSEAEIRNHQQFCGRLSACLSRIQDAHPIPEGLKEIKTLADYFIIFAGSRQASGFGENAPITDIAPGVIANLRLAENAKRELVDLSATTDPAIVKFRGKVGLPAPKGFVYLRYYPGRPLMPGLVKSLFQNPNMRAVTLLGRYIAVCEPESGDSDSQLNQRIVPKAVSHELIHAYINASLNFQERMALPLWFQESCAIYFSGSGRSEFVTDVMTTTVGYEYVTHTVRSTTEYEGYRLVFDYLEAEIGEKRLCALIRHAIETRSVNELYVTAGVANFDELLLRARDWHDARENTVWGAAIAALILVVCLLLWRIPKKERPPSL